jgi:hypothetical protein
VMMPALVIMTITPIAIDTLIFLDPFYLSLLFSQYQSQ